MCQYTPLPRSCPSRKELWFPLCPYGLEERFPATPARSLSWGLKLGFPSMHFPQCPKPVWQRVLPGAVHWGVGVALRQRGTGLTKVSAPLSVPCPAWARARGFPQRRAPWLWLAGSQDGPPSRSTGPPAPGPSAGRSQALGLSLQVLGAWLEQSLMTQPVCTAEPRLGGFLLGPWEHSWGPYSLHQRDLWGRLGASLGGSLPPPCARTFAPTLPSSPPS